MTVNLSPVGIGFQFLDSNGKPLNGGFIYSYAAGTTNPQATYTTNIGNVANTNPIVLNADGRPPNEIWLSQGVSYKFQLTDSLNNILGTFDNLSGINDISNSATTTEWINGSFAGISYLSGTSFSVTGDQTSVLTVNRRLKTTNTGGVVYGYISASSFAAGVTTVTVVNDSGALDSGLSAVYYGIINSVNTSSPTEAKNNNFTGTNTFTTQANTDNSTKASTTAFVRNVLGFIPTGNYQLFAGSGSAGNFTAQGAGNYLIIAKGAGGGGGGGKSVTTTGIGESGQGGGEGELKIGIITLTASQVVAVTPGLKGNGGGASANGTAGGNTTFGALLTANGGIVGLAGASLFGIPGSVTVGPNGQNGIGSGGGQGGAGSLNSAASGGTAATSNSGSGGGGGGGPTSGAGGSYTAGAGGNGGDGWCLILW